MIKRIGICLGLALTALSFGSAASATSPSPQAPVFTEIRTSPSPVSWPDSPSFEYRVEFRAGPTGADFSFSIKEPSWGFYDGYTYGSPFHLGTPALEGPGRLKLGSNSHGDPGPLSCFRGAWGNHENSYSLDMDPDSTTTVVVPASLGSAPLPGMDAATTLTVTLPLGKGEIETQAAAPNITGKSGVRIISHVVGTEENVVRRKVGKRFRLAGYTRPVLANRKLVLSAQSRLGGFGRPPLPLTRLGTVKTDGKGRFRSAPFRMEESGPWLTYARPAAPSRFAIEQSCGPALDIGPRVR